MNGIKNRSIRDLPLPTYSERARTAGVLPAISRAIFGPTDKEIETARILQESFQPQRQTRVGVPEYIAAPGQERVPFEQLPVETVGGSEDTTETIKKLIAAGNIDAAAQLAAIYGTGKGKASQAKVKTEKIYDAEGNEYIQYVDPYTAVPFGEKRATGINRFDKDVNKISSALTAAKVQMVMNPLETVDRGIMVYRRTGKLPGVGYLKNKDISTLFKSKEGLRMQNAVKRISEIELRALTGAAAPDLEKRRVEIMNALSTANSAEDYVDIYTTQLRPLWVDIINAATSTAGPQVRARWARDNPFASKIKAFTTRSFPSRSKPTKQKTTKEMSDEELLRNF